MKARPIQIREWNYLWRDDNSHLYRYRGNRFFLTSNGTNWTQDRYVGTEIDLMQNGYSPMSNEDAFAKIKSLTEKAEKEPCYGGYLVGSLKNVDLNPIAVNIDGMPKDYPAPPVNVPIPMPIKAGFQGNAESVAHYGQNNVESKIPYYQPEMNVEVKDYIYYKKIGKLSHSPIKKKSFSVQQNIKNEIEESPPIIAPTAYEEYNG